MTTRRVKGSASSEVVADPDAVKSLCHACSNHARCAFAERVERTSHDSESRVMMLTIRHGCALFHEGMPLIGSYIVCKGLVAQYASESRGRGVCIHGRGASPDLVDNLTGASYHRSSAIAVGDVVVAFLPELESQMRAEMHGLNMITVLRQTARQARILEERLIHGRALGSYERVAELFRGMIEASESTLPSEGPLSVPMDRPLFATFTGMMPETFSRAMTRLQKHGLVIHSHGILTFPRPDQLCRLTREGIATSG
ncbi:MAG: Crp/Fnr family transcriptional regulator [Nitrospira sp.]|nr:Crp/Fnr family transcriptional regulator [Nitrospira sp.]